MTLQTAGWIGVGFEVILLFCWLYNIYGPNTGTDPAGAGIGQLFTLLLLGYLAISVWLMFRNTKTAIIIVLVMAALPLAVTVYGLWRYYSNR